MVDAQYLRADDPTWPARVTTFWFDTVGPEQWFVKDAALDSKITASFQMLYEDLTAQSDDLKATTAARTLALILVLESIPTQYVSRHAARVRHR